MKTILQLLIDKKYDRNDILSMDIDKIVKFEEYLNRILEILKKLELRKSKK